MSQIPHPNNRRLHSVGQIEKQLFHLGPSILRSNVLPIPLAFIARHFLCRTAMNFFRVPLSAALAAKKSRSIPR
jgi:hypothetical protein